MNLDFEFDPEKSYANKLKHGLEFEEAKELWEDPWRVVIPTRCKDEERWLLIAMLKNNCWIVIYTIRDQKIRIISVRKSRKNEKEIYHSGRT
ncbi:MAG: BrnT family toxin [Bacteroidia bacterium]|nr:BrnT family toxin [Bacteroidia bacterium]